MTVGGQTLFLRTGEYEDGSLGEIFIDLAKSGSLLNALMNNFCISTSLALQHGASLEWLVNKFTFVRFHPCGMVQGHEHIKMADSIVDAVFRDLGIHYLKKENLKHGAKEENKS